MDPAYLDHVADLLSRVADSQPTLRDRFALAALQGVCARLAVVNPMTIEGGVDGLGPLCWEIADAMLRARTPPEASNG